MKDVFYFLLVLLLAGSFFFAWKHDNIYEVPKDIKGVVIDKDENFLIGNVLQILTPDTTVQMFRCYDILFDSLQIGDSVNYNSFNHKVN